MMTLRLVLCKSVNRATLVVLACTVLFIPTYAFSAERDGTVLFLSFEDLKQIFSHPLHPALPQVLPTFSWRDLREQNNQQSPIERNYRWGNGLGIDGHSHPGTHPLWGY